ncbi:hypothetical protein [Erwinia sp. HR93]|uniref:hypothetical protein n=1 Tax=Erwinia sp. HR93 TaxID=3094840 RepID=UPI002ADECDDA|nr:hypothetical protein [Erwinia sp. HR93]MEA1062757.1 hypothetical protein [Erwinia sp. HR93]
MNKPIWMAVDPAEKSGDSMLHAVIYRINDRWKLHDFWVVNFKAFILDAHVRISDSVICGSAKEACNIKPGAIIQVRQITDEQGGELPF